MIAKNGHVNIWLSEHVDLKLLSDLQRDAGIDVLAHAMAYIRYQPRPGSQSPPVTPLEALTDEDFVAYAERRREWDTRSRRTISDAIAARCAADANGVHPSFAGVIERLFDQARKGCLDALMFARAFTTADRSTARLRIIAGENYPVTELVTLVWWLAIAQWLSSRVASIEWVWVSRQSGARRLRDVGELLDRLTLTKGTAGVDGAVPERLRAGGEPVQLAWVGALRYAQGWAPELERWGKAGAPLLRIAERNCRVYHEDPCLELTAGDAEIRRAGRELFDVASREVAAATNADGGHVVSDDVARGVDAYFATGVAPVYLRQLTVAMREIDRTLGGIDLRGLFSTSAAFTESIALHAWARQRGVRPVLLPHSWTSIHDFPSETYDACLTFVRSGEIMPAAKYDAGTLTKEHVVGLEEVMRRHAASSRIARATTRNRVSNARALLSYPIEQAWRTAVQRFRRRASRSREKRTLHGIRPGGGLKIGYVLNFEQSEFTTGLDFNRHFTFIRGLAATLGRVAESPNPVLVLRAKTGWTNLDLLRASLGSGLKGGDAEVVISPSDLSLKEFGESCDVVAWFQGTSAVPELMSFGVPVVELAGTAVPPILYDPYIVFPEPVVPRMTLEQLVAQIQREPRWLSDLETRQRDWILTQMA